MAAVHRDIIDQLRHIMRPHATRIANMVARAVVQLVDDSTKMQLVQLGVLEGETVDGGENFQTYGLSAVPLAGAEAVVTFPNGDRSHPLVIAVSDRRYRPTGSDPGEVVLYTDEGDEVRLARGHAIVLGTIGTIQLGSDVASEPGVLGNALMTALGTLVTSISTAVGTSGTPAGATAAAATIAAALVTFQTAAASFLSAKVKLE